MTGQEHGVGIFVSLVSRGSQADIVGLKVIINYHSQVEGPNAILEVVTILTSSGVYVVVQFFLVLFLFNFFNLLSSITTCKNKRKLN